HLDRLVTGALPATDMWAGVQLDGTAVHFFVVWLAVDDHLGIEQVVTLCVARSEDDGWNLDLRLLEPRCAVATNEAWAFRLRALREKLAGSKQVTLLASGLPLVGGLDAGKARPVGGDDVRRRPRQGGNDSPEWM